MRAEADDSDGISQEVPDPEGYRQHERTKHILNARKRVLEKKRQADELLHGNQITEQTRDTVLRSAVEEYLLEVETLMKECDTDKNYWGDVKETEDGEVVRTGVPIGQMGLPNGGALQFRGVGMILDQPNPITVQWKEQVSNTMAGAQLERREEEVQIPAKILLKAYRMVNEFLMEINMDLDTEEEQGDAAFTYSDILQEGPPEEPAMNADSEESTDTEEEENSDLPAPLEGDD